MVRQQLAVLEHDLKAKLFLRTPRGYVPTEAADQLADVARRMEAAALEIENRAAGAQAGEFDPCPRPSTSRGAGIGELPTYVGDEVTGLIRVLPEIGAACDVWLGTHGDLHRTARAWLPVDAIARQFGT
ncbi:hypothetical protein LMG28614_07138 [Paraburkholderia ultramafica]|uniref:HTH lysR-type domain-containing protein n=2 Tax=Paraburkholderia ultramafica TaxID=1544867 RepID=A0A6S7BRT8_9BURK|nr:hypothetical protein LMG28614_07138 [Paraburkholderia ultramafica]